MSSFVSKFKCKKCYDGAPMLAPNLVSNGYPSPFDGKCPVCDTIHSLTTGEIIEDTRRMHWRKSSGNNWKP